MTKKRKKTKIKFTMKVGGHPNGNLIYYAGIFSCGNVKDGIHLEFEKESGGFVVDFNDFIKVAKLAQKDRP